MNRAVFTLSDDALVVVRAAASLLVDSVLEAHGEAGSPAGRARAGREVADPLSAFNQHKEGGMRLKDVVTSMVLWEYIEWVNHNAGETA